MTTIATATVLSSLRGGCLNRCIEEGGRQRATIERERVSERARARKTRISIEVGLFRGIKIIGPFLRFFFNELLVEALSTTITCR